MSTQSGYKINNSQSVKSCKIKRSEADNLYKTLTGLIHKQCSYEQSSLIIFDTSSRIYLLNGSSQSILKFCCVSFCSMLLRFVTKFQ